MARNPKKLTPEVVNTIEVALSTGAYIETAAALAGISKDTLYRWMKTGAKARSGIMFDFHRRVTVAMAQWQVTALARIAQEPSWQASAWRLERKHPEQWGKRVPKGEDTTDSDARGALHDLIGHLKAKKKPDGTT